MDSNFEIALNSPPLWHRCAPDWNWAPRALPDYDFWFVAAGRGQAQLRGQTFELHPGVCFVWRPGDAPLASHQIAHPLQVFSCHFRVNDGSNALWLESLPQPQRVRNAPFFAATARRTVELWARGGDDARAQTQILLGALLWQLNDEAQNPAARADGLIENLADELRAELDRSWTLDAMASSVHLSRAQLVRRFRTRYGLAPMQFLNDQRLQSARALLLETDWTLETIARHLGMGDAAFFSRQFKTKTGVTPGSLRR